MTKLFLGFFISLLGAVSFHNFYVSTTSIRFVPMKNPYRSQRKFSWMILNPFFSKMGMKNQTDTRGNQEEIDILVEDYFGKNITFKAQEKHGF